MQSQSSTPAMQQPMTLQRQLEGRIASIRQERDDLAASNAKLLERIQQLSLELQKRAPVATAATGSAVQPQQPAGAGELSAKQRFFKFVDEVKEKHDCKECERLRIQLVLRGNATAELEGTRTSLKVAQSRVTELTEQLDQACTREKKSAEELANLQHVLAELSAADSVSQSDVPSPLPSAAEPSPGASGSAAGDVQQVPTQPPSADPNDPLAFLNDPVVEAVAKPPATDPQAPVPSPSKKGSSSAVQRFASMQQTIATLNKQVAQLQEENGAIFRKLDEVKTREESNVQLISTLLSDNSKLEDEAQRASNECAQLREQVSRLTNECAEQQQSHQSDEKEMLLHEREQLRGQLEIVGIQLSSEQEQKQVVEDELKKARVSIEAAGQRLMALQQAYSSLEESAAHVEQQASEKGVLETRMEDTVTRLKSIVAERDQLAAEVAEHKSRVEQWRREYTALQTTSAKELVDCLLQRAAAEHTMNRLLPSLVELESTLSLRDSTISDLEKRLESKQQLVDDFEKRLNDIQTQSRVEVRKTRALNRELQQTIQLLEQRLESARGSERPLPLHTEGTPRTGSRPATPAPPHSDSLTSLPSSLHNEPLTRSIDANGILISEAPPSSSSAPSPPTRGGGRACRGRAAAVSPWGSPAREMEALGTADASGKSRHRAEGGQYAKRRDHSALGHAAGRARHGRCAAGVQRESRDRCPSGVMGQVPSPPRGLHCLKGGRQFDRVA